MVLFAYGNAAAGQHQVVALCSDLQGCQGGLQPVGHDAQVGHHTAHAAQQGRKKKTVGVVNSAGRHVGRRYGAGHDQLIARGKQGYTRLAGHLQLRQAHAGGQAQGGWTQALPTRQDGGIARDVFAPAANPLAGGGGCVNRNGLPTVAAGGGQHTVFLHHHRVGTRWNRRAGEDAGSRAHLQWCTRHPGGDALRHRQCAAALHIGAAQGVAVHRAIVLRRHLQVRDHVLGQHAPIGVQGGEQFLALGGSGHGGQQLGQRRVQGKQGGTGVAGHGGQ